MQPIIWVHYPAEILKVLVEVPLIYWQVSMTSKKIQQNNLAEFVQLYNEL
jgi:hypothetical protein